MNNKIKKDIINIDKKSRFSSVAFLFFIFLITSCIISYVIGKYSMSNFDGKIIDTIIIEEPQNTDKLPVYLTGEILYSDGTPYVGKVQLFSKAKEAKTNNDGIFLFQNIVYGKHTLVIVDNKGNTISEMSLTINQSTTSDKILIIKKNNGYEVSVGINIALIELNLEIDKNKKEIVLSEDNVTSVNYNGKIITVDEINSIQTKIIETFNGNKVMPEGIIVLPNNGVILANGIFINNTGQIYYSEGETSLPNGFSIRNDNSILLPNKTIIKSDGTIIRPQEEETKPVNGDDDETEKEPVTPVDPSELEDPIEPEKPEPLTWDAPIVKQGNMSWDQLATLDLFATNDSAIAGKIYPGVSGSYEFSIENVNPYNVLFSLNMKEQEHEAGSINLSYRLKYYDDELNKFVYVIGDEDTYLKPSELSTTDKVTLLSNSKVIYILEWTWANENNIEQDLKDGKIGTHENKVHYIDMTINIENA